MEYYSEESNSSHFGPEGNNFDDESFEDDEVGGLLRACQTVAGDDDDMEEITVPDDDDVYSEYTFRSGQDTNGRNHQSFSTVNEEELPSSDEEDDDNEENYTESSRLGTEHTVEEEEYVLESDVADGGQNWDSNVKEPECVNEERSQTERTKNHAEYIEEAFEQNLKGGSRDLFLMEQDKDGGSVDRHCNGEYQPDVEEQRETELFIHGEEEIIFEAEKDGIYYQGRSVGRGVVVSVCLATSILIFMTGFLSAYWSNPNSKRASSATTLSRSPDTARQTIAPTNRLATSAPTIATSTPTSIPTFTPTSLPSSLPTSSPSIRTLSPTTLTPSQSPTRDTLALSQTIGRAIGLTQVDKQSRSQERAFDWIVNQDEQQLTFDDPTLVQRFLLANLFFSASSWGNENWMTNSTECTWAGVDCNGDGQVSHLNLTGLGIVSSIPTELQFMTALELLDLSSNNYYGSIPDPLSALVSQRRWMETDNILLRGHVPALRVLNLGQNNLNGSIPSSIGLMMNLLSIELGSNSLSGKVPEAIGMLPKLEFFDASNNTLEGELPTFFSQSLSFIDVGSNNFSGSFDDTVCAELGPNFTEIVIDCENIECSCCGSCSTKPSSLFVHSKQEVDGACGPAAFRQDDGERCEEICAPHFFECCNPFDGRPHDSLSSQNKTDQAPQIIPDPTSMFNSSQCNFAEELKGCITYSKCHSLTSTTDPAPANLPDMCSFDRLRSDPRICKSICAGLECCYSSGRDNCLTEKFDICIDYSPCQNLRLLNDKVSAEEVLETAPKEIEFECSWRLSSCNEICEAASCCTSTNSDSCFQSNFLSCLTYSPCSSDGRLNITIPPQFSAISKPPLDWNVSCSTNHKGNATDSVCDELCASASCCFAPGKQNCFTEDPLGCLTWSSNCLAEDVPNSTSVMRRPSNASALIMPIGFDSNSSEVRAACGLELVSKDGGQLCMELCNPHFPEHCRPFYSVNGTTEDNFVEHISSCVDYAKCQVALDNNFSQPAPSSLPTLCSIEQLQRDPEACVSLCEAVDCCFSSSKRSCLVEDFNLCLDYVPCQNLRYFEPTIGGNFTSTQFFLPVATPSLGMDRLDGNDHSTECEKASCCGTDSADSCLRSDFMSCLTYASCPTDSDTSTTLPPRFSFVPQIPLDIWDTCYPSNVTTDYSCEQYCEIVACCFTDGADGCFEKDPLGCLEWQSHCQV